MTVPRQGEIWWAEASFDKLQRAHRSVLTEKLGEIGARRHKICGALDALADC